MQFIDLMKQYKAIEEDVNLRLQKVLEHQAFIMGPEVKELEERLAQFVGVKHCITCANGTDALIMPLMAYGVKPGDAIFVPAFTFFATAECVSIVGATPIFVDVNEETFNIDVRDLERAIEEVISEGKFNPRGIIPVDLFGLAANYIEIEEIAKKYNLFVLEDAAQSFGGSYNGKMNCSHGDVAATSFFPAKPLGCYGDGGAIFTNDDDLASVLESIRVHGKGDHKYENVRIGLNSRLDTLQAAILLAKMEVFEEEIKQRNFVATQYNSGLSNAFLVPKIPEKDICAWAQYTLKAADLNERNHILAKLKDRGIPSMIYYPKAVHLQKAYSDLGYKIGDMPVSEKLTEMVFSLPMHPYLSEEEIDAVVKSLLEIQ